jgi:hypothetical protein
MTPYIWFSYIMLNCGIIVADFYSYLYVFLLLSMYSCCSATLPEVFPCFFLSCKANARV